MKTGAPTGTVYMSKAARRRYGQRMRAEEDRWRSLNGSVTVTKIQPDEDEQTRAARDAFLAAWCDEDHHEVEADPNRLRGAPRVGQDGACHVSTSLTDQCSVCRAHRPG